MSPLPFATPTLADPADFVPVAVITAKHSEDRRAANCCVVERGGEFRVFVAGRLIGKFSIDGRDRGPRNIFAVNAGKALLEKRACPVGGNLRNKLTRVAWSRDQTNRAT